MTVATNALLERRGACTALLTTAGFADVLVIGRQNRPFLYRLSQQRPAPLVPDDLRFEVAEGLDAAGAVLRRWTRQPALNWPNGWRTKASRAWPSSSSSVS